MSEFRLPLSGDVSRTINPWTWFCRSVGGQFGLININLGKSPDPVLEERIRADAGTSGRQIGQIGDVLRVFMTHIQLDGLTAADRRVSRALEFQPDEIDRLKAKRRGETRPAAAATKTAT
jgi:hypothetical protein